MKTNKKYYGSDTYCFRVVRSEEVVAGKLFAEGNEDVSLIRHVRNNDKKSNKIYLTRNLFVAIDKYAKGNKKYPKSDFIAITKFMCLGEYVNLGAMSLEEYLKAIPNKVAYNFSNRDLEIVTIAPKDKPITNVVFVPVMELKDYAAEVAADIFGISYYLSYREDLYEYCSKMSPRYVSEEDFCKELFDRVGEHFFAKSV